MPTFERYTELDKFIEANKVELDRNYLHYYHLHQTIKDIYRGNFELFDACNVRDDDGSAIIFLAVSDHLLFYSEKWSESCIQLLEMNTNISKYKGFHHLGARELVVRILEKSQIPYLIYKDRLIYECTQISNIQLPSGKLANCQLNDIDKLGQMGLDYYNDEYPGQTRRDLAYMTDVAKMSISRKSLYQWANNGDICSIAMIVTYDNDTPMIGELFTPAGKRGLGYGTAVLHSLTSAIFGNGFLKTVLVSDLANPASNKVFVKVGYTPIFKMIVCERMD